jgi:DNA-directed RNA polymerase subunit K/omega
LLRIAGVQRNQPPPLIESHSKNYLTLALEEIASNKIRVEFPSEK